MKTDLIYLGTNNGISCYKNSEGFIEGYRPIGKPLLEDQSGHKSYGNTERIVSTQTTVEGFLKFVNDRKKTKDFMKENNELLKQTKMF